VVNKPTSQGSGDNILKANIQAVQPAIAKQ
jgi:hypothetical protein